MSDTYYCVEDGCNWGGTVIFEWINHMRAHGWSSEDITAWMDDHALVSSISLYDAPASTAIVSRGHKYDGQGAIKEEPLGKQIVSWIVFGLVIAALAGFWTVAVITYYSLVYP